jgi:hypothetical protein
MSTQAEHEARRERRSKAMQQAEGEPIQWSEEILVRRAVVRGRMLEVASAAGGVVVLWQGALVVGYGYARDGRVAVTKPSAIVGAPPSTVTMSPEEGERAMVETAIEIPSVGVLHLAPLLVWAWRAYQARCAEAALYMPPVPATQREPEAPRSRLVTH